MRLLVLGTAVPSLPAWAAAGPTCDNKPIVSLNLKQFTYERDQHPSFDTKAEYGTCASFAGTAGVEAAVFRRTGRHQPILGEWAALQRLTNPATALTEMQDACADPSCKPSLLAGNFSSEILRQLLQSPTAPSYVESARAFLKPLEIRNPKKLATVQVAGVENAPLPGEKQRIDRIVNVARKINQKIVEHSGGSVDTSQLGFVNLVDFRIENPLHAILTKLKQGNTSSPEEIVPPKFEEYQDENFVHAARTPKGVCDETTSLPVQRQIMKALCRGIPPVVSVSANGVGKLQNYRKSDQRLTKYFEGEAPAGHAMVARGIRYIGPTPYFILRDSQGARDQETLLPFSEACEIQEA